MPRIKQIGAIWEAQQQGAFLDPRIPEPVIEEPARLHCTTQLRELLPLYQVFNLMKWAQTLRRANAN